MRDHILLAINGQQHRVSGVDVLLTLSDFLRGRLGLTGTKIVCSEGDCGSCTVLCGRVVDDGIDYLPIDSCIRFVFQLDGTHIVSVEGLNGSAEIRGTVPRLTEVQQKMVDCHGSQCGFCTPGFVMAMTGLLERQGRLTEAGLRYGLTGNLCRCTGYTPIIEAGKNCDSKAIDRLDAIYPPASLLGKLPSADDESIAISIAAPHTARHVFCPTTIEATVELLAKYPAARLVAGATDIGVQINKGQPHPEVWIDLNRVRALKGVEVSDNTIVAGARATWTEIEDVSRALFPEFHKVVAVFGSPQIRHVGTIGGNLVNASPISDSVPFLSVCDAQLEIVSAAGRRLVDINDFYRGYKRFDLNPGELLAAVHIPIQCGERLLRLYKVSRRRDLDIASFTAAIWMELDGETIQDAGIAYGAVGPVVLRLRSTEAFLRGKPFDPETMQHAGDIAVHEISPITDVRGGTVYRLQLARNVMLKFYYEIITQETVPT